MAFVGFTIIYQESQPLNHYKRLVLLGNILAFLVSSSILGRFFTEPLEVQTLFILLAALSKTSIPPIDETSRYGEPVKHPTE